MTERRIAVAIPCYRVAAKILDVIGRIGPEVAAIYVVDDACPERSGEVVETTVKDPRVRVIRHGANRGVGAATITGWAAAVADGADILVKLDGDGQMDPAYIPNLVLPVLQGEADYAKGNRFYAPEGLKGMPAIRLLGNGVLSFFSKLSSGYWTVLDPTNGYVALHAAVFKLLPREKLAQRFFFESDLLFRLNLVRAGVVDVAIASRYADERSNLRVHRVVLPFIWNQTRNFFKRVVYSYFVSDFSVGSLYLIFGFPIFLFGILYGLSEWNSYAQSGRFASAGTVMLAALPVIIGFQLLLSFLAYDVSNVPRGAIHRHLPA
jgi:dolichol-phosphate mannosyltransferase